MATMCGLVGTIRTFRRRDSIPGWAGQNSGRRGQQQVISEMSRRAPEAVRCPDQYPASGGAALNAEVRGYAGTRTRGVLVSSLPLALWPFWLSNGVISAAGIRECAWCSSDRL